jgi:hypothetical protein
MAVDSLWQLNFRTINADTFSTISGYFSDADSQAAGSIHLKLTKQGSGTVQHSQTIAGPGPYEFKQLLPGVYQISGFRDQDDNGVYSFGRAVPFVAAERFFVSGDSIKVRAGWPNEGNDIVLGK